jgi:hypothetical protein
MRHDSVRELSSVSVALGNLLKRLISAGFSVSAVRAGPGPSDLVNELLVEVNDKVLEEAFKRVGIATAPRGIFGRPETERPIPIDVVIVATDEPVPGLLRQRLVARIVGRELQFDRDDVALTAVLDDRDRTSKHDIVARVAEFQPREEARYHGALTLQALPPLLRVVPGQSRLHGFVAVTEPVALGATLLPLPPLMTFTLA